MANPFNQERLELKVKARKAAIEALQFLKDSVDGDVEHFWKVTRDFILEIAPLRRPVEQIEPMTDVQARRFENQEMPYGEFKGQPVSHVPLDRLDWYAGQGDEFKSDLKRYLANEEVRLRVREEVGE